MNYPNPLSRETDILFRLPAAGHVRLSIHDVSGRRLRTVLDARQPAGSGAVTWDGRNENGVPVPAGIYFCRLESEQTVGARKMAVIR